MHLKNRNFYIAILIFLCLSARIAAGEAQIPSIVWERSLGGIGFDFAFEIVRINGGGYVVGGRLSTSESITRLTRKRQADSTGS